jgi:glycosyltransferase involved in cell wall biosynthesis
MHYSLNNAKEAGSQTLVSVIMNCYNGAEYLREAIDSVVAQTYQNWELIFWDNQSTDNSADIFNSYTDPRLKYFYAPTHTLLYEARNYAIAEAQGEFIAFLDVDDWWEQDKLEKQIPLFDDEEVALVYGNFWLVNERKKKSRKVAHSRVLPEGRILNHLLEDYVVGLLTMVIRRRAVSTFDRVFDLRYQMIGDFDIAIRLAAEWKLDCIQTPVASYRWHGDNLSIRDGGRPIGEWETWYSEMQQHPIVSTQTGLRVIFDNIGYMKIMRALIQGERVEAFSLFWRYPLNFKKLKLLSAIFMPFSILKAIRT